MQTRLMNHVSPIEQLNTLRNTGSQKLLGTADTPAVCTTRCSLQTFHRRIFIAGFRRTTHSTGEACEIYVIDIEIQSDIAPYARHVREGPKLRWKSSPPWGALQSASLQASCFHRNSVQPFAPSRPTSPFSHHSRSENMICDLDKKLNNMHELLKKLRVKADKIDSLKCNVASFEGFLSVQNRKVADLEDRSRRSNLSMHGIPETPDETEQYLRSRIISDVLVSKLGMPCFPLQRL